MNVKNLSYVISLSMLMFVLHINTGCNKQNNSPHNVFNVQSYGAKGDGATNDTNAINSAITAASFSGTVYFPSGTYLVTSKLVQTDGQRWTGSGGQRGSTIKKGSNNDLVEMGDLAIIDNLNFDCNGTTYTGRGILVSHGYSQIIRDVRIVGSASYSLDFATDAGGGARVDSFEGAPLVSTPTVPVIHITSDTTAKPRFFSNIWLAGGVFDIGGCNDLFINNAYLHDVKPNSSSTNVFINNCRFAASGDSISIAGTNINYSNCSFAAPVSFTNAQACRVVASEFSFGYTIDNATCQYNTIQDHVRTYTPTWTQASGEQPSLGNGTITGWYVREGYTVRVSIRLTIGTTTTFGNNGTSYLFSLPQMSSLVANQYIPAAATVTDTSLTTDYILTASIATGSNAFSLFRNAQGFRSDSPFILEANDEIYISFQYAAR